MAAAVLAISEAAVLTAKLPASAGPPSRRRTEGWRSARTDRGQAQAPVGPTHGLGPTPGLSEGRPKTREAAAGCRAVSRGVCRARPSRQSAFSMARFPVRGSYRCDLRRAVKYFREAGVSPLGSPAPKGPSPGRRLRDFAIVHYLALAQQLTSARLGSARLGLGTSREKPRFCYAEPSHGTGRRLRRPQPKRSTPAPAAEGP